MSPLSPSLVHGFWTQSVRPVPESLMHTHRLSFLTREQEDQSHLDSFEKRGSAVVGVWQPWLPSRPAPAVRH